MRPIIAANWKMNKTGREAEEFLADFKARLDQQPGAQGVEVVLCPPFTLLETVGRLCSGSGIRLGAQNIHWEKSGAYTGEISALMLKDLGVEYVIVGHSERRRHFGEDDRAVALKTRAALENGLTPIICVGEKIEERRSGRTKEVVGNQLQGALQEIDVALSGRVVVAYEPLWAIGTGEAASGNDANMVAAHLRGILSDLAGVEVAAGVRIQYGGSVTAVNAAEFLLQPEIQGALVGGASLAPDSFAGIVAAAV